jgi:hypothetical protein
VLPLAEVPLVPVGLAADVAPAELVPEALAGLAFVRINDALLPDGDPVRDALVDPVAPAAPA